MLFNANDEDRLRGEAHVLVTSQRDPCVLALTDGDFSVPYDVSGPHMRFATDEESAQLSSIMGRPCDSLPIRDGPYGSMGFALSRRIIFHARRFLIRPPR